ncbi:phytanoyl-CoA dioxygenase family protein [Flavobacterium sp.]|uniref:phytanoyl-CoA dioxygenase family protein n=1 Tax=Flavobacterium sp. TaxID=239 RepID=UPI002B4B1494|nr:phytanoyl-CoA dioxygenase family protein [Flavobacterium sp.]HLP63105.1 phytanoyl-CoA dioxygenase family protein [Flavobacterium sp.]
MNYKNTLNSEGFTIIESIYTNSEIDALLLIIEKAIENKSQNKTFRQSDDLFAIRQFLHEIPEALDYIFNKKLSTLIKTTFSDDYFISKSIYFDKPEKSNWFVSYHQDLTISVNKKVELENFKNWTLKQNQYSVQPPESILKDNFTIRIHLDTTTKDNGALKVITKSHQKGIIRTEDFNFENEDETLCEVKKGGIMLMKPLLFHASNKTTNNNRRRVIHIEFSKQKLPSDLKWNEIINLKLA